ncbi:MAG: SspB family protein [Hasllibacter sp.]
MTRRLDYGSLMHRAMRGLIREVLDDIAEGGLPGEHHFFITFDTMHPDVGIADWLSDRYPGEMTIVLQHWFDALEVDDEGFSVTLNFGDAPERLRVPFEAIRTFVDPSVEFGLRFEAQDEDEKDEDDAPAPGLPAPIAEASDEDGDGAEAARPAAEVVSLDQFRKS